MSRTSNNLKISEENRRLLKDMNEELNKLDPHTENRFIHDDRGLSLLCTLQDYENKMTNEMVEEYLRKINFDYKPKLLDEYMNVGFIELTGEYVELTKKGEMFIDFMVMNGTNFEKKYSGQ